MFSHHHHPLLFLGAFLTRTAASNVPPGLFPLLLSALLASAVIRSASSQTIEVMQQVDAYSFALSNDRSIVAIAGVGSLCTYLTGKDDDKLTRSQCYSAPNQAQQLRWSPKDTAIAILGSEGLETPQVIHIINFTTGKTFDFPAAAGEFRDIAVIAWLDDRRVISGASCGTGCLSFRYHDTATLTASDDCSLGVEGNLRSVANQGRILGMGGSGELVEVSAGRTDAGQSDLKCVVRLDGCLNEDEWYRVEDSLDSSTLLVSKQQCDRGAQHQLGAQSALIDRQMKIIRLTPLGSPVSVSFIEQLVASIKRNHLGTMVEIARADDFDNVLLTVRLPTKINMEPLTDFDWDDVRPKWSLDDKFLAVAGIQIENGIRALLVWIINIDTGSVSRLDEGLDGVSEFAWLNGGRLIAKTDSGLVLLRVIR